jgi:uncharacterized tellurite resistance protein B-like protein
VFASKQIRYIYMVTFIFNPGMTSLQIDSQQEAYLAILYALVSVDEQVTEDETDRLIHVLVKDELFKNTDLMAVYKKVQLINQSIRYDGYKLIEMAAPKINKEHRTSLFKQAVEMLQADGVVFRVEKELLQHLRNHLFKD